MAYQSEIEKLEARFKEKPEQWFAALADAYRKNDDLDLALEILTTWLEQRPNYTSGHIVLGRVYMDRKQDAEAVGAFERVLELDAENIIALKALSEIAYRTGDASEARRWLQRLLEVDPMNDEAQEALERVQAALSGDVAGAAAPSEAAEVPEPVEAAPAPGPPAPPPPEEPASTAAAAKTSDVQPPEGSESAIGQAPEEAGGEEVEESSAEVAEFDIERASAPHASADIDAQERFEVAEGMGLREMEIETGPEEVTPEPEAAAQSSGVGRTLPPPVGATEPQEEEPVAPDEEELEAEAPAEAEPAPGLMPFDDQLAWGTGERTSETISSEDLEAAEQAHDEALEETAHYLPGLEGAEVPDVGVEERQRAAEEVEPAGDLEIAEHAASSESAAEATQQEGGELPLIMPDDVTPEVTEERESGLVVTETMAELYVKQGLVTEAVNIYRQLVARRPDEPHLGRRLAELEHHAQAAPRPKATAPVAPRYSVVMTGGESATAYLKGIFGKAVEASPMDEAFAEDLEGEPTRPAGDDVSLAAVFGEEAPPAAEPTPKPGGDRSEESSSFDEFFSPAASGGAERQEAADASEGDSDDDDEAFKAWLKGLKT